MTTMRSVHPLALCFPAAIVRAAHAPAIAGAMSEGFPMIDLNPERKRHARATSLT
jgi:hypothetical protein